MKGDEMQNLVELEKEVAVAKQAGTINDEYCKNIIAMGNVLSGYGLYLAREIVHGDSKVGWERFCNSVDMTKRDANRKIAFYEAKSGTKGPDLLPDKERQFRALRGDTTEEKVEAYKDIKEVIKKDHPTAGDIAFVQKVKSRATGKGYDNPELAEQLFEYTEGEASTEVKKALYKAPSNFGLKRVVQKINAGEGDRVIIDAISGGTKVETPKTPDTCIECREQNKKYKTQLENIHKKHLKELDDMEADILRREKDLESVKIVKDLTWALLHMSRIAKNAKSLAEKSDKAFREMKPDLENALKLLKLSTISEPTKEEVKRNYHDMAKKHHPDKNADYGSGDMFVEINKAYKLITETLEGKK